MPSNDQVYKKLQRHLDKQAIGFPATRTGAEISVLKRIFSPQEAEITCFLNYKFESVATIFKKAEAVVPSERALVDILQRLVKKGGIGTISKNSQSYYCCLPLVVGMFELQQKRLTQEFVKDLDTYIASKAFGIDFISTKLPQMRTIPVHRSIDIQHNVNTYDEVTALVQKAAGPFAILDCICREKRTIQGKSCQVTDRKETCLAVGDMAKVAIDNGTGKDISRNMAVSILAENQREGLVLQPSNTQEIDFICSCCGCCCGMLRTLKRLPKPLSYWATNFFATVEDTACKGCGICETKCQVDAITVSLKGNRAVVDLDRCIGCGVCVANCSAGALSLSQKSQQTTPPQTRDELLDIIMENKKGRVGKLMVAAKLVFDAVRTGRTRILK